MQENSRALSGTIRDNYADRLAGMYIEHVPAHPLVVRLTGAKAEDGIAGQTVRVEFRPGAASTRAELMAAQKRVDEIHGLLPTFHGSSVDEMTAQLVLFVGPEDAPSAEKVSEVSAELGVPVHIFVGEPARLDIEIAPVPEVPYLLMRSCRPPRR